MIGDRHTDVAAGRDVGTRTVGVLWGYGSRAELEGAGADVLLEHPRQLADLLQLSGSTRDRARPERAARPFLSVGAP